MKNRHLFILLTAFLLISCSAFRSADRMCRLFQVTQLNAAGSEKQSDEQVQDTDTEIEKSAEQSSLGEGPFIAAAYTSGVAEVSATPDNNLFRTIPGLQNPTEETSQPEPSEFMRRIFGSFDSKNPTETPEAPAETEPSDGMEETTLPEIIAEPIDPLPAGETEIFGSSDNTKEPAAAATEMAAYTYTTETAEDSTVTAEPFETESAEYLYGPAPTNETPVGSTGTDETADPSETEETVYSSEPAAPENQAFTNDDMYPPSTYGTESTPGPSDVSIISDSNSSVEEPGFTETPPVLVGGLVDLTENPVVTPTSSGIGDEIENYKKILIFTGAGVLTAVTATGVAVFIHSRKKEQQKHDAEIIPIPAGDVTIKLSHLPNSEKVSMTPVIIPDGPYRCGSCIGQGQRNYQEDSLWFSEASKSGEPVCLIIADGMGGMENGAESSARAIKTFRSQIEHIQTDKDIPSKLWQICNAVNEEVFNMNSAKNMNGGATLVCAFIVDNLFYWISVGDSRIYLYRDGMLASVNEEHELETSMYSRMLDDEIKLDDIRETPNRELRKLTSNLGRSSLSLIDQNFIPYKLHKGDKLLLCSDGVSGTLDENELLQCLADLSPIVNCELIQEMIEDKNKRGQDNYSAIVAYIATEDGK